MLSWKVGSIQPLIHPSSPVSCPRNAHSSGWQTTGRLRSSLWPQREQMKSPRTNPDVFRDSQKTRSLRTRPKWTDVRGRRKGQGWARREQQADFLNLDPWNALFSVLSRPALSSHHMMKWLETHAGPRLRFPFIYNVFYSGQFGVKAPLLLQGHAPWQSHFWIASTYKILQIQFLPPRMCLFLFFSSCKTLLK